MFLFLTTLLAKNSITFEFFENKDVKIRILKNNQEIPFSETGIDLPIFDEVIISFKNNQTPSIHKQKALKIIFSVIKKLDAHGLLNSKGLSLIMNTSII
jgi:hypothetical protein